MIAVLVDDGRVVALHANARNDVVFAGALAMFFVSLSEARENVRRWQNF